MTNGALMTGCLRTRGLLHLRRKLLSSSTSACLDNLRFLLNDVLCADKSLAGGQERCSFHLDRHPQRPLVRYKKHNDCRTKNTRQTTTRQYTEDRRRFAVEARLLFLLLFFSKTFHVGDYIWKKYEEKDEEKFRIDHFNSSNLDIDAIIRHNSW